MPTFSAMEVDPTTVEGLRTHLTELEKSQRDLDTTRDQFRAQMQGLRGHLLPSDK